MLRITLLEYVFRWYASSATCCALKLPPTPRISSLSYLFCETLCFSFVQTLYPASVFPPPHSDVSPLAPTVPPRCRFCIVLPRESQVTSAWILWRGISRLAKSLVQSSESITRILNRPCNKKVEGYIERIGERWATRAVLFFPWKSMGISYWLAGGLCTFKPIIYFIWIFGRWKTSAKTGGREREHGLCRSQK